MTEKESLEYIDKLKLRIFYLEKNADCYRDIIKNKETYIAYLKKELKRSNDKLRIYKEVNYKQYCIEDY